jgi:hypothetical protein
MDEFSLWSIKIKEEIFISNVVVWWFAPLRHVLENIGLTRGLTPHRNASVNRHSKHHTIEAYRRLEINTRAFQTSALYVSGLLLWCNKWTTFNNDQIIVKPIVRAPFLFLRKLVTYVNKPSDIVCLKFVGAIMKFSHCRFLSVGLWRVAFVIHRWFFCADSLPSDRRWAKYYPHDAAALFLICHNNARRC